MLAPGLSVHLFSGVSPKKHGGGHSLGSQEGVTGETLEPGVFESLKLCSGPGGAAETLLKQICTHLWLRGSGDFQRAGEGPSSRSGPLADGPKGPA